MDSDGAFQGLTLPQVRVPLAEPLETYLLAVTLAGTALFVAVVGQGAAAFVSSAPAAFWVFAGLVLWARC